MKLDCIYHFPIDGKPNQTVRLDANGKYNLISGWFDKISKRFLCKHKEDHE